MTELKTLYTEREGNYDQRKSILISFVMMWLNTHGGGKTFENRHIVKTVLEAFKIPGSYKKQVSRDVSKIAREGVMRDYVREKENDPGSRVFVAPGSPEGDMYQEPEFESLRGAQKKGLPKEDMYAAARELKKLGWLVVSPAEQERGETVKTVDTSNTSRHPKNGYKKVTCGECGGQGHVFMRSQ